MHYVYDYKFGFTIEEESNGTKIRMMLAPQNITVNEDGSTTYKLSSGDTLTIRTYPELLKHMSYITD